MPIKLVDLLIESVFEDTNTEAVYNELIPNPATGKPIKVKSALSRSDHPAYQAVLDHIEGRAGSGDQTQQPAQQAPVEEPVEEPAEEPTEEPAAVSTEQTAEDLIQQGFSDKGADFQIEKREEMNSNFDSVKRSSDIMNDPKRWNKISPERQKEIKSEYNTSVIAQRDNLKSQIDGYTEEGQDPPPELLDALNDWEGPAQQAEFDNMSPEEQQDAQKMKAVDAYEKGLGMIDIDQDLAGNLGDFDEPETATGI